MDPKIAATVAREIAIRDLEDIFALRRSEAFTRYFTRRLKEKRDQAQKRFHDDPMDKDQREVARHVMKTFEEILSMMDREEATIRQQLGG